MLVEPEACFHHVQSIFGCSWSPQTTPLNGRLVRKSFFIALWIRMTSIPALIRLPTYFGCVFWWMHCDVPWVLSSHWNGMESDDAKCFPMPWFDLAVFFHDVSFTLLLELTFISTTVSPPPSWVDFPAFFQYGMVLPGGYLSITRWWQLTRKYFYFHPYLGKIPILTIIFFKGVETTNQISCITLHFHSS